MLFDEKDYNVFDNNDSRTYFKEILQSYYSQNYRATVVLLCSFVIYDLFIKMQTMASEGDDKAANKLSEIKSMISDDAKYSQVENEVIKFFLDNCSLYFNRFEEDITYLKSCRNKCAHLKVDDNTLFVPKDYQVRMLICSMYDNILSVKAPFIMDLFTFVQEEIEDYSSNLMPYDSFRKPDDLIISNIETKYIRRMTYNSIKKSYKTFIKLLLISEDDDCIRNIYGLFTFVYALTIGIVKLGYTRIYGEEDIVSIFLRITKETLQLNELRPKSLAVLMIDFPSIMDAVNVNDNVFEYMSEYVLFKPKLLKLYRTFYPRNAKTMFSFFKEHTILQQPSYTETLYECLKQEPDFNADEFMKLMVNSIPFYNGFHDADVFTSSLKKHIEELSINGINEILTIYNKNNQCTMRSAHTTDISVINQYLSDHTEPIERQ